MKKLSLKLRIVLPVLIFIAIGLSLILVVTFASFKKSNLGVSEELSSVLVNEIAMAIKNDTENTLSQVLGIISSIKLSVRQGSVGNMREFISESISDFVYRNKEVFGAAFVSRVNFDGLDGRYSGGRVWHSSSSGRFIPLSYYESDGSVAEKLFDFPEGENFFVEAMNSQSPYLGEPFFYINNSYVQQVNVPVLDSESNFIGVICYFIDLGKMQNKLAGYKIFDTGYPLLISEKGRIIYHTDPSLINLNAKDVLAPEFYESIVKTSSTGTSTSVSAYSGVHKKEMYAASSLVSVSGTKSNLIVQALIPKDEIISKTNSLIWSSAITAVIVFILVSFILYFMLSKVISPLDSMVDSTSYMIKLGDSAFASLGSAANSQTRDFYKAFKRSMNNWNDVMQGLDKSVSGDEVSAIKTLDSINKNMVSMMNHNERVLEDVADIVKQINSDTNAVAEISQDLADGTISQAAAVEELSSNLGHIAQMAENINQNASQSNHKLDDMVKSIDQINESSHDISNVIKVIDDIAFQTNILALNAAVEAAHAGDHGKGFAVVAEEIRALASKSAQAAKNTNALISDSISKSNKGNSLAKDTKESLGDILFKVSNITDAINELNRGVTQISDVVQKNSASAQSTAAASYDIASKANTLNELISSFDLTHGGSVSTSGDKE